MADWNPGRSHWWTTTAIATTGALVGGTSLVMNFFYPPSPPPTTIDSSHSEFMKLSYSDRIDRSLPYIEEHFDEWRDRWRTALTDAGTSQLKSPITYAPLDDSEATGQAIVNSHLVVVNYAEKLAPADEGGNLLSCVYSAALKEGPNHTSPDIAGLVGSGNDAPKADNIVVHESAVCTQGAFAGVTAEGRPNGGRSRSGRPHVGPDGVGRRRRTGLDEWSRELQGRLGQTLWIGQRQPIGGNRSPTCAGLH
jgi:hypothetical protein